MRKKKKKKVRHGPRRTAIHLKIMECITLDYQPFSIIQDAGFTKLVELLEPCYAMPSCKYFSDQFLPELYSIAYSHVKNLISGSVSISLTTDIWSSSINQVSMLRLTAQWLDEDFVLKKTVHHSQECCGSQTADQIASSFEWIFEKWNISEAKVPVCGVVQGKMVLYKL